MPQPSADSPTVIALLRSLAERLSALEAVIEARSAPARETQQALRDILDIYNITGQTGSVVSKQHQQIQALAEAMTIFHGRLLEHDKKTSTEREEIHGLIVQLRSLAHHQVSKLDDIQRELDTSPQARSIISVAAQDAKALLQVAAEHAQSVVATAKQDAAQLLDADTP